MKSLLRIYGLLVAVAFIGCAGDDADLEEARFYLGKGGTSNATKAKNLVEPKLTKTSGATKLEAYRLYIGALVGEAGFDSNQILAHMVYKDSDGDSLSAIRPGVTLNTNSEARLSTAKTTLTALIASDADYAASKDTRLTLGLNYQLGLVNLFSAIRGILDSGDLSDSGTSLTKAECIAKYSDTSKKEKLVTIHSDCSSSDTSLTTGAGLDRENKLVKIVTTLEDKTPNVTSGDQVTADQIDSYCDHISSESSK